MGSEKGTVYVIDDDHDARRAAAWLLSSRGIPFEAFESAEAFEAAVERYSANWSLTWPSQPSCLLLDIGLPGLSGLQLFERLLARDLGLSLPVIFLTGQGDVSRAVFAVENGAYGFIEKPADTAYLLAKIEAALSRSSAMVARRTLWKDLSARVRELTPREREVTYYVTCAKSSKEIAEILGIGVRTVENLRLAAFSKLGFNGYELVNRFIEVGKTPDLLLSSHWA